MCNLHLIVTNKRKEFVIFIFTLHNPQWNRPPASLHTLPSPLPHLWGVISLVSITKREAWPNFLCHLISIL